MFRAIAGSARPLPIGGIRSGSSPIVMLRVIAGNARLLPIGGIRRRHRRIAGTVGKGRQLLRAVFPSAQHRPDDRAEQGCRANIEGIAHRIWNLPFGRQVGDAQPVAHHPRQRRGHHRPQGNEEALHDIAARPLARRQHVADEGAKRLHGDIDGCVQNPEGPGGHPQGRRMRHGDQGQGGEDGAEEEIGPPPSQEAPGAVAQIADDGLHHQPGEGRRRPEQRQAVHVRAQSLEDAAGVGVLQGEPELNAEKAEAQIPDLPETQQRLFLSLHAASSRSPHACRAGRLRHSAPSAEPRCRRLAPSASGRGSTAQRPWSRDWRTGEQVRFRPPRTLNFRAISPGFMARRNGWEARRIQRTSPRRSGSSGIFTPCSRAGGSAIAKPGCSDDH